MREKIILNYEVFNTVNELSEFLRTTEKTKGFENKIVTSHDWENPDKKYAGVSSREEYLNLLKYGYLDGLKRLKKVLLKHEPTKRKYVQKNSVVGSHPNVPKYILGLPQDMRYLKIERVQQPVIKVYFDITVSGYVSTEEIEDGCAKFLSVIEALEKSGTHRVELNIICAAGKYPEYNTLILNVKKAGENLNLSKISFPMLHPAFLRGVYFEWVFKAGFTKPYDGYGIPIIFSVSRKTMTNALQSAFGNSVYIPLKNCIRKDYDGIEKMLLTEEEF